MHIIEPGYFATNIADPGKASHLIRAAYEKCDPDVKEYYGSAYVEQGNLSEKNLIIWRVPNIC